jgi:hypothetical protein
MGGDDIFPTVSQLGTRERWVVKTMLRPLHPREIPGVCTEVWVGFGTGLDGTEISPLDQRIIQPIEIYYTYCVIPAAV